MRHITLIIAVVALAIAAPAIAGKGNGNAGNDGVITVPDAQYGGSTTATVNPGGADAYVLVQCYAPDLGGSYVYAAYFPVDSSNHAAIGPLSSTLWPRGDATCTAQEGYYTRNGFGRWESLATTTFRVDG